MNDLSPIHISHYNWLLLKEIFAVVVVLLTLVTVIVVVVVVI